MNTKKLLNLCLATTFSLSLIGFTPIVIPTLTAEAAIKKYERKSITILGESDNILNKLFTRMFRDLGRFDYYNIPVGEYALKNIDLFISEVRSWYEANKKAIAMGKTVPDLKFKDRIITREEAEKIVNAAYVMVPNFEIGQIENLTQITDKDTKDSPFGILEFSFNFDIILKTQIYNIKSGSIYSVLSSKQTVFVNATKHYLKSKGSTQAFNYLNSQRELLINKGIEAVLNSLPVKSQDYIVRLMSPDELAKITEDVQKNLSSEFDKLSIIDKGKALIGLNNAIIEGFDPQDPNFKKLVMFIWKEEKDLNSNELEILEKAYDKLETQGLGTITGKIVRAINSNLGFSIGLLPDTIKQAKSLDAFIIKSPAVDADHTKDFVALKYGKETGVDLNNWYRIQEIKLDEITGQEIVTDKAWVKIRKVGDNRSEAQAIIVDKPYEDDDQMVEYPMLGYNINIKPGIDMINFNNLAIGAGVVFETDISGWINRVSNRQISIPELYSTIELGAGIPIGKVMNRETWLEAKLKVGIMQRMYLRQIKLLYGLTAGAQGFMGEWGGTDKYAIGSGLGVILGAGYQLNPNFSIDLQTPLDLYIGTKNFSDTYLLFNPRLGINLHF